MRVLRENDLRYIAGGYYDSFGQWVDEPDPFASYDASGRDVRDQPGYYPPDHPGDGIWDGAGNYVDGNGHGGDTSGLDPVTRDYLDWLNGTGDYAPGAMNAGGEGVSEDKFAHAPDGTTLQKSTDTSGKAFDSAGERVSSDGAYHDSRDGGTTHHTGIDIVPLNADGSVNTNAHVQSISSGTVVDVGYHKGFGNNTVVVQTPDGNFITYGHMSSSSVKVGDPVTPGTALGVVGSEGNSTGPHVHIQETVGGAFTNSAGFQGYLDPGSH